jgi:isopenicillin-N N-acyltransferase like protein
VSESRGSILGPVRPRLHMPKAAGAPPPWGSQVEWIDGIPMVRLAGSPEKQGFTHGAALAPQVLHLIGNYLGSVIGSGADRARAVRLAEGLADGLLDDERAELRGLARGTCGDVSREDLIVGNTFLDVHRMALCSTIIVRDPRTGHPLFGRNLDFPSFGVAHRLGVLFVHAPTDGAKYVTVGWPGLLGALSGMNRAGVAVAVNLVYGAPTARTGVPLTLALRRVLTGARDLAGAEDILGGIRFASSNNITVCDAAGRAAVFEVGPDLLERRLLDDGPLLTTNHFVSRGFRPTLSPISISSHYRYARLKLGGRELRRQPGLEAVKRALRRVALPKINLQGMIFEPATARIHLSMGRVPAARGRFVPLGGTALWGT